MKVKELLGLSLILTPKVHLLRYSARSLGLIWPILRSYNRLNAAYARSYNTFT